MPSWSKLPSEVKSIIAYHELESLVDSRYFLNMDPCHRWLSERQRLQWTNNLAKYVWGILDVMPEMQAEIGTIMQMLRARRRERKRELTNEIKEIIECKKQHIGRGAKRMMAGLEEDLARYKRKMAELEREGLFLHICTCLCMREC